MSGVLPAGVFVPLDRAPGYSRALRLLAAEVGAPTPEWLQRELATWETALAQHRVAKAGPIATAQPASRLAVAASSVEIGVRMFAQMLGCSTAYARRLCDEGMVGARQDVPGRSAWRIDEASAVAFARERADQRVEAS